MFRYIINQDERKTEDPIMSFCTRWSILALAWAAAVATLAAPAPVDTLWVDAGSKAEAEDGSVEAPFRSIAAAMKAVGPGDVVTVRAGVYREQFSIPPGEPGRPITLRAAEGHRVVVTGCQRLEGWTKTAEGPWMTTLDWRPDRLMVGSKIQTIAREPDEGWWQSATAGENVLSDPQHLKGIDAAETGGNVRIWLQHGNVFSTVPVQSLDTRDGRRDIPQLPRELE